MIIRHQPKYSSKSEEVRFRHLFDSYYKPLVCYAGKYLPEQDTAENIVQDLFTKIWEDRGEVLGYRNIGAYLYKMIRLRCFNYLRDERKKTSILEKINHKFDIPQTNDYIREETYRLIMAAVNGLPRSCREIFHLSLQGFSASEIAEKLQISVETVKKQKQIARNKLKEKLVGILITIIIFFTLIVTAFQF